MADLDTSFLKILLVVVLSSPKCRGWFCPCYDRARVFSRRVERFEHGMCSPFLFGSVCKDDGTILRTMIRPLSIYRRWIMILKEYREELLVWYLRGVVLQLNDLNMPGSVRTDLFICRIVYLSSHIPNCRVGDTRNNSKEFLGAPKAAHAKCSSHTSSMTATFEKHKTLYRPLPRSSAFVPHLSVFFRPSNRANDDEGDEDTEHNEPLPT